MPKLSWKKNGIRFYRSGDFAKVTEDGKYYVFGRMDNQIKLRGFRIEIGEVESVIKEFEGIKSIAVVLKNIDGNDHLCAYFTVYDEFKKDGQDYSINVNALKEHLNEKLTYYMVPTVYMELDEIPQTANGKTDVRNLPEPKLVFENVAPVNDTEGKLLEMVSGYINADGFGVTDDLYALGFTSLSLMKFNVDISESFDVNLDILDLLDNPTIRHIAGQIDDGDSDEYLNEMIESSKETIFYPLMDNQLGVYYECAQNPDEAQYNLPAIVRFDKSVDAARLRESIIKTIDAYPYLKTRIVNHEGQLMHRCDDSMPVDEIPIVEVNDISDEEIEKENVMRFELLNSQLFRAKIYKTDDETILFFDVHHIISDGESLYALFNGFANAYNGEKIESEVFDGYMCSLIEKEDEDSEEYASSNRYFHEQLSKEVDSTVLTPDLNNDEDVGRLQSICENIDSRFIKKFCAEKRISPNILFMASTILTLNKYTFTDKVLFTTIFNGRSNSNYYNTQAFLVKTLPIVSINEDRDISVMELLSQIDDIWKNGIKHSNYPYIKIAEEFDLKPEFMYTYNNLENEKIRVDDVVYSIKSLNSLETNYKITLDVNETEDGMELVVLYNDALYSEGYIKTFMNSVLSILSQFIDGDIEQLKINEIELGKCEELPDFTPVENPILHKRFESQAVEKANDVALVASDATLTYGKLNEKSNRIFTVSIVSLLLIGILFSVLGTLFSGPIIAILCPSAQIQPIVFQYYSVYIFEIPFLCFIMCLSYFIRADGLANLPFRALLVANVVNIIFDIIFIGVFGWGLSGAAGATIAGYILGSIYMATYFFNPQRTLKFVSVKINTFMATTADICKSGFSGASTQLYFTIKIFIINTLITLYVGQYGLVAFNICCNSLFILYMFLIGTAQTMSPIVSVYYQEEDYKSVEYITNKSLKIVLASSLILSVFFIVCPQSLLMLYHVNSPSDIPIVLNAIRIFSLSYVGIAVTFLYTFYAQAIQKDKLSNIISILEGCVFPVIFAFLLSFLMGADGIWISFTIAEVLTILYIFAYSRHLNKKTNGEYSGFFINKHNDDKKVFAYTIEGDVNQAVELSRQVQEYLAGNKSATLVSLAIEEMLVNIININENVDAIDVIVKNNGENILISIKDTGVDFNPVVENDALEFDNISVLNRIADKIEYSRVLGLNSTVITVNSKN